jgi:hypothetical protein
VADSPDNAGRFAKYREKLIDAAVLTIPTGLITGFSGALQKKALGAPWALLWIVVPLVVAAWLTYRFVRRERDPLRHWRWAVLLICFCSLFSALSAWDLLLWRSIAAPDQQIASRPWLLPVRTGDWHYTFARRTNADFDTLAVLLLKPGATVEETRRTEALLIRSALKADNLIGIALDMYFVDPSPADDELCAAINAAGAAKVPVYSGYTLQYLNHRKYIELPDTPPLPCQPREQQGHLLGFADSDGRVRAQQRWFHSAGDQPSLSTRIADTIRTHFKREAGATTDDNVLRYLPPVDALTPVTPEDIQGTPAQLNGTFLLVGLDTPQDRFDTPFGIRPGTYIQAYSALSQLTGTTLRKPSALWSAATILASCYLLMLLALQGFRVRNLLFTAALLSLLVWGAAALCMYAWYVWVDVIYPVTAIWLWLAVLICARRRLLAPARAVPAPSPPAAG